MTTLTNPTDDELNMAFAVHVSSIHHPITGVSISAEGASPIVPPTYTDCMDAVLPWLMQQNEFRVYGGQYCTAHCVVVTQFDRIFEEVADTTPKACVLALLKAHGVEVVYDKEHTSGHIGRDNRPQA